MSLHYTSGATKRKRTQMSSFLVRCPPLSRLLHAFLPSCFLGFPLLQLHLVPCAFYPKISWNHMFCSVPSFLPSFTHFWCALQFAWRTYRNEIHHKREQWKVIKKQVLGIGDKKTERVDAFRFHLGDLDVLRVFVERQKVECAWESWCSSTADFVVSSRHWNSCLTFNRS